MLKTLTWLFVLQNFLQNSKGCVKSTIHNCHDWKTDPKGVGYKGTQSSGLSDDNTKVNCQIWNSNQPNQNIMASSWGFNPGHNYCRNPDQDSKGPWCYKGVRSGPNESNYVYCKELIPQCTEQELKSILENFMREQMEREQQVEEGNDDYNDGDQGDNDVDDIDEEDEDENDDEITAITTRQEVNNYACIL